MQCGGSGLWDIRGPFVHICHLLQGGALPPTLLSRAASAPFPLLGSWGSGGVEGHVTHSRSSSHLRPAPGYSREFQPLTRLRKTDVQVETWWGLEATPSHAVFGPMVMVVEVPLHRVGGDFRHGRVSPVDGPALSHLLPQTPWGPGGFWPEEDSAVLGQRGSVGCPPHTPVPPPRRQFGVPEPVQRPPLVTSPSRA